MAYAIWQHDATDDAGNILENVEVEVRRQAGGLQTVFADFDGEVPLGSTFIAADGKVRLHAPGGFYTITLRKGDYERVLEYVAIGLAAASDYTLIAFQGEWNSGTTYLQGDYVIHNNVGVFVSTGDGNLDNEPYTGTSGDPEDPPQSTAEWVFFPGIVGPASHTYVAYASDDQGADFTTTFDPSLPYIAVFSSIVELDTPQASDFAGLWSKFKGNAGSAGEPLVVTVQDGVHPGTWPIAPSYQAEASFFKIYAAVFVGIGQAVCRIARNGAPVYGPFTVDGSDVPVDVSDLDLNLLPGDNVELVIESVIGGVDFLYVQLAGNAAGATAGGTAFTPSGSLGSDNVQDALEELDENTVDPDEDANLTAGFTATSVEDGTKASGTYTPGPAGGNFRKIVNGGSFTLAAPTAANCYNLTIDITNNDSAGIITFTGFATDHPVNADLLTTVENDAFKLHISKTDAGVTGTIEAL